MDSATSHHHYENDDEKVEAETIEALDTLAGAIGDERAIGSALFLSGHAVPPRAFLGNPPRSTKKKGDKARSGPDTDEKR